MSFSEIGFSPDRSSLLLILDTLLQFVPTPLLEMGLKKGPEAEGEHTRPKRSARKHKYFLVRSLSKTRCAPGPIRKTIVLSHPFGQEENLLPEIPIGI